jgi:hypothetical protein
MAFRTLVGFGIPAATVRLVASADSSVGAARTALCCERGCDAPAACAQVAFSLLLEFTPARQRGLFAVAIEGE